MSTLKVNDIIEATSGGGKAFVARAWMNVNQSGTQSIRDSEGVSSITDDGVSDTTMNFANTMANTGYAVSGMIGNLNTGTYQISIDAPNSAPYTPSLMSTSAVRTTSGIDRDTHCVAIHGTLA